MKRQTGISGGQEIVATDATGGGGGGGGPIEDGVNSGIKATVRESTVTAGEFGLVVINPDGSNISGGGGGGGAVTIAAGADVTEGNTTDAKVTGDNAGTVSAKLRGINYLLNAVVDTGNSYERVHIENASLAVTGPLTDTQLRATAVPISAASLPLPSGAATETTLGTRLSESDFDTKTGSLTETAPGTDTASSGLNGRLQRIAQRLTSLITALGSPFQAGGSIGNTTFASTQSGTWTVQPGNTANTTAWKVDGSAVTQPVSAASLPLPSGASTAALQTQPGVDIGDVTINNAAGASAVNVQDGGNSLTVDGSVTVTQGTASNLKAEVTNAGTFAVQASQSTASNLNAQVVGNVADDGAASGNPVVCAGIAISPDGTDPGNVSAEGDVTRNLTDLNRIQFVRTDNPRAGHVHLDGSSAYTDQNLVSAPGSGLQTIITNIIFGSNAATAINFFLEEGSTKIFGPIALEAVAGRGFCSGPIRLPVTANTAVTLTTSAAIAQAFDMDYFIQKV